MKPYEITPMLNAAVKSEPNTDPTRRILNNVNFSLLSGSTTSIMGPNGCGKSTLFGAISLSISLESGNAYPRLTDVDLAATVRQDFRTQTVPWLSLRGNLDLVGRQLVKRECSLEQSCKQLLERIGYKLNFAQRIETLSGGECQAFILARSLALSPQILIWDEPFSAIDINRKFLWYREVAAYTQRNEATFCFSTHDLDEALMLSNSVRVFDAGMLLVDEIDLPGTILRNFASLSSPEMVTKSVRIRKALKGFRREDQE